MLSRSSRAIQPFCCFSSVPSSSPVVIIGGGIIGTSTLYHLSTLGIDAILLERDKLTSGTTWHAAGLMITFGSLNGTSTEWRKYTKSLYSDILPKETGLSTGFKPCGFIELATSPDRLEEYRRISTFNRFQGVDVREITPEEVNEKFPLCDVSDVLAGFYVPTDGRVNPYDACQAFARGAREKGGRIIEDAPVKNVIVEGERGERRVKGVEMESGEIIETSTVVNAGGMWARQLAELSSVVVPNQAAEHYYLITEKMEEVDKEWPVVEDPSSYVYIRPEGDGLMLGLFEAEGASWNEKSIPEDFSFGEINPDWERMMPYLEKSMARVPSTQNIGMKNFFCGPESFTPDNSPVVGEAPECRGYFVAAGLNSIGILTAGGVGRTVAEWIDKGKPDVDVTGILPSRFKGFHAEEGFRRERVKEAIGRTYKCHYPNQGYESARGVIFSPLNERLKGLTHENTFRDVSGWESPMYYGQLEPEWGFGKENYEEFWEAEHKAVREGVGMIDMSFMSKFIVEGKDAGKFLNRLSTADVDGDVDMITYTQWLDEFGYLQADLTVTKLGPHKFMLVATDTQHRHVEQHMIRRIGDGEDVAVSDATEDYAYINLQGPKSRELMQAVTGKNMDDDAFPFRAAKEIEVAGENFRAVRITYVGELGYELYVPADRALAVYDKIIQAGKDFGLAHVGLKALGSLRLEKGYRDYGHDLDNLDTLVEAGLGFTADMKKEGGFIGKEKVVEERARNKERGGMTKRMVSVVCEDSICYLHHGEVLTVDGVEVGEVRAGSQGFSVGGAVGLVMVEHPDGEIINKKLVENGKWEVKVANRIYDCRVSLGPPYDPKNVKIKG